MKKAIWLFAAIAAVCILFWMVPAERMNEAQKHIADGSNEYAIILGAKVNGETPSLTLRYRLAAAVEYAEKYPHVRFVLSGGQGRDEEISEAQAMYAYLIDHGIAEERLILESRSTSTYENLLYSKELLPDLDAVTIISSDFHLARARFLARQLGWDSDTVAAKTPDIVKAKVHFRERLALFKTWLFRK